MELGFSKPGSFFKAYGHTWTAGPVEKTYTGSAWNAQRWTAPGCLYCVKQHEKDSRFHVSVNPAMAADGSHMRKLLSAAIPGLGSRDRDRTAARAVALHESVIAAAAAISAAFPLTRPLHVHMDVDSAIAAAAVESES